ncbi:uncharacterized protein N7484_003394 [Penicillium longicatenatum]|uniref:uncharacterized protein n=1 Tax=Penicillium longicatenatum TaxID=1561947 RepID=UPI0025484714|nr:uncharacterized protein N7484_003394 [Penicillium longicatenatum]KAJ5649671.1 hypothetical protein N7484_003394 [Penicillium longicatenatum]
MDAFDAEREHLETSEAEDIEVPNASPQSPSVHVVNGQNVNTSTPTLHANDAQAIATQYTSTVASVFPTAINFNATSHNILVQPTNPSAATSQIAIPQANVTTLASTQGASSSASASVSSNNLQHGSVMTGVGTQSTSPDQFILPGRRIDPSGTTMDGISNGRTANFQSHNSQTDHSVNQGNLGTGLDQASQAVNNFVPNVSTIVNSTSGPNSGNADANTNLQAVQNLHPVQMNTVASSAFPTAPASLRINDQRVASVATTNPRTSTLAAAYQAYYQISARNQSLAAHHVNPNHGTQANANFDTNIESVHGLSRVVNPGQAMDAQRQADALRAVITRVIQARNTQPCILNPQNHTQGPFLDLNDPVSVEIREQLTNSRALTEHRDQAGVAIFRHQGYWDHRSPFAQVPLHPGPSFSGQSLARLTDSQAATQRPTRLNRTTQTADNDFDVMLQAIEDQDTQLAVAGLDNRGSRLPSRLVQLYTESDSLQAYLIRQQLVAGIPPDEVVPMDSYLTQQRLLHGGPPRASGPVLIRVQRGTGAAIIPYIPPARFIGRLDPLPFDMQNGYPTRLRGAQTTPSDETQPTTDNDVVMNDSDGTTPHLPDGEDVNRTD